MRLLPLVVNRCTPLNDLGELINIDDIRRGFCKYFLRQADQKPAIAISTGTVALV